MTMPLLSLSSATSTRPRKRPVLTGAGSAVGRRRKIGSPTGRLRLTVKQAPCPGELSSVSRPPISSTSRREIASPRPVPPYLRAVEPSACENCSNIFSCNSGAIPMPVSRTLIFTARRPSISGAAVIDSEISPLAVNLRALDNRLITTWRRRKASTRSGSGISGRFRCQPRPLSAACTAGTAASSRSRSPSSTSTASSSRWPDSIFEKSRMSLMIASRCRPERSTPCTYCRCSSRRGVASSNSVMPSTPFIGVRISWLIIARNSLLARLPASAASLA